MSSPISQDDVAKIAKLARLRLTDEELDRFTHQLADVLGHAADLDALDLSEVPPTTHPYPLVNVWRDDVPVASLDRAEVLAAAPEAADGQFVVPPILGEAP